MKLEIKNLCVEVEGKRVLNGISAVINPGEIHALMGPNGSGKSTLSYVLAGHPKYKVVSGDILFDGERILDLTPDERAMKGLFLSFQNPLEISGVSISKLLFTIAKAKDQKLSFIQFKRELDANLQKVGIDAAALERDVNVGFSGGEKKRIEVLQLLTLKPAFAILDEVDSGLDVDTMQVLANAVNQLRGPNFSALVITHYQRLLNYINPDFVHVLSNGKIVMSGSAKLAQEIEAKGYQWLVAQ
ncbi:MAG TPA: Fe-S cluster assembly ATPase SufC [Candidatus Nanoarchaeia archaeon]|nr:Fe-S cluster assembly ATPase SufC [Candidatus Nanoarchaeia archaeon]